MWPKSTGSTGEPNGGRGIEAENNSRGGSGWSGLRALLLLAFAVVAVAGMTFAGVADPTATLNYDGDQDAPNPYGDGTLTVAKVSMADAVDADGFPDAYEDDDGDLVEDPLWKANKTYSTDDGGDNANPITYDPAKVEGVWAQFPRDTSGVTVVDASEWEQGVTHASNVTVSNTTIAANVDAVKIDTTDGGGTDVVAQVSFENHTTELDSDESKLVAVFAGDVTTLEASARVEINITDESGDYKQLLIEPDASGQDANASVMATSTGTFFYQVPLTALSTTGGGSWDNIESINVTVRGGEADVTFSEIDLERKTKINLGDRRVDDADSDSDLDNGVNETYNATGTISIKDLNSVDSAFDSATFTDVKFKATVPVSRINGDSGDDGDYLIELEDADDFPSYDHLLNTTYRLQFPTAIDLSWSSIEIHLDQEWPSGRYETLGIHEDADGENLTSVSLTDKTGNLGSKGDDNIDLDTSITAGDEYVIQVELLVTGDEWDTIDASSSSSTPASSGGGGGGPVTSMGGLVGWLIGVPGVVIALVTAGFARLRGWI